MLLIGVALDVGLHQSGAPELGEKQGAKTRVELRLEHGGVQCKILVCSLLKIRIKFKKITGPISPPAPVVAGGADT